MPGEHTSVDVKCQENAGECRGIQGNTGECQKNVWKWVQSARGTHGSGCIVPMECRVPPGECKGVGVK